MLEDFKAKLKKRVEKKAIKLSIDGETIYLKKGGILSWIPFNCFSEWGRIYMPINEDGSWNLPNLFFGGWKNLIKLILVLLLAAMILSQFYSDFQIISKLQETCTPILIPNV
jgi:hypothetical protein